MFGAIFWEKSVFLFLFRIKINKKGFKILILFIYEKLETNNCIFYKPL